MEETNRRENSFKCHSIADVRNFMARHVSSTKQVNLSGEIVGRITGQWSKKRLTLMSGEDFLNIEVPSKYCLPGLRAGSQVMLRAKPRFEPKDKEVVWTVDEVAGSGSTSRMRVLAGVGPIETARRRTAREFNLEPTVTSQLAQINSSGKIANILVVCGHDSQVEDDFDRGLFEGMSRFEIEVKYRRASMQGQAAKLSIPKVLDAIGRDDADVVVLMRGGGSYSDFVAFDDREIVRSILACAVPVVTALGHSEHVPLASVAASASFVVPHAAGNAIRKENAKRYFAGQPSATKLNGQIAKLREENRESDKRLKDKTQKVRSLEDDIEHQHVVNDELQQVIRTLRAEILLFTVLSSQI